MSRLAETVRRIGFRKWYERQLIDGHLWLITCFLCMVTVAAVLEDLSFREGLFKAIVEVAVVFAAGGVGWFGWKRYQVVLGRAEYYGAQSVCGGCQAYARFEVVDAGPEDHAWLRVRCRKCGHCWTIE